MGQEGKGEQGMEVQIGIEAILGEQKSEEVGICGKTA